MSSGLVSGEPWAYSQEIAITRLIIIEATTVTNTYVIDVILMIYSRQEPCVYVNGKPYSVRSTDDMANHLTMTEVERILLLISIVMIFIWVDNILW